MLHSSYVTQFLCYTDSSYVTQFLCYTVPMLHSSYVTQFLCYTVCVNLFINISLLNPRTTQQMHDFIKELCYELFDRYLYIAILAPILRHNRCPLRLHPPQFLKQPHSGEKYCYGLTATASQLNSKRALIRGGKYTYINLFYYNALFIISNIFLYTHT